MRPITFFLDFPTFREPTKQELESLDFFLSRCVKAGYTTMMFNMDHEKSKFWGALSPLLAVWDIGIFAVKMHDLAAMFNLALLIDNRVSIVSIDAGSDFSDMGLPAEVQHLTLDEVVRKLRRKKTEEA